MKEKLLLAIVITFTLSCIQNLSSPAAARMKMPAQVELSAQRIASLLLDSGANQ